MKVTIAFRDTEARAIRGFLAEKYGAKKGTSIEALCKLAIRREVAEQAKKELADAEKLQDEILVDL